MVVRRPLVVVLAVLALGGVGCQRGGSTAAAGAAKRAAAGPAERLSAVAALPLVLERVRQDTQRSIGPAGLSLAEVTPAELWERMGAQIFTLYGDANLDGQSYIIRAGVARPLGVSFSGDGVMSMCVADLDGEARPELLFTYSFGSGVGRSVVGMWTGGDKWIDATPAVRDLDLSLEKTDDAHVSVAYGAFDPITRVFTRRGTLGTVHLKGDGKATELRVDPALSLPADVEQKIWRSDVLPHDPRDAK